MGLTRKQRLVGYGVLIEIALLAILLGLYIYPVPIFNPLLANLDSIMFDFFQKHHEIQRSSEHRIEVIALDDNSLDYMEQVKSDPWPISREFYQPVIDFVSASGAKAIIFDIDFFNRFIDDGGSGDIAFAQALAGSERSFLTMKFQGSLQFTKENNADQFLEKIAESIQVSGELLPEEPMIARLPIKEFAQSANGFGFANVETDRDGKIRRYALLKRYKGRYVPSLALAAVNFITSTNKMILRKDRILSKSYTIPLINRNEMVLNWYGVGYNNFVKQLPAPFGFHSFANVMEAGVQMMTGEKITRAKPSDFRDAIVIVGGTSTNLYDFKSTPLSAGTTYEPGLEVHATAILNLLNEDALRVFPLKHSLALMIFLALLMFSIVFLSGSLLRSALLFVGLCFAVIGYAYYIFTIYNDYLQATPILLGIGLSFFIPISYRYFIEKSTKDNIKRMFDHYLDPTIIDSLINKPESLKIGGESKQISIFFSDIQGFTTLSEKIPASTLITILNDYLSKPTEIIMLQKGYVDKYIGDAIMALFGAPISIPNHAELALDAALKIQEYLSLREYETLAQFGLSTRLITRIGIHSGPAIIGNIGSDSSTSKKFNYTAIGDSVNLASRLEGFNKVFGTTIAISDATKILAGEGFLTRPLDLVAVKGKNLPILVHELLNWKDKADRQLGELVDCFLLALSYYDKNSREFAKAITMFGECLKISPNDQPAMVYIDRCRSFLVEPPPDDWNGVYYAKSK